MAATNTASKAPRVPPSPNSVAARTAATPDNRASRSRVAQAVTFYSQALDAFNDLDSASFRELTVSPDCTRTAWINVTRLAEMAMHQSPETTTDLLFTLGIAAAFAGTILDALAEDHPVHATMVATSSALENAVVLLSRDIPRDAMSPGLAVIAGNLLEDAIRNGGEIEEMAA